MTERYESMRINAPKGQKVIYMDQNGYSSDQDHARQFLKKGSEYTVEITEVSSSNTNVILSEFPNKKCNSVMFQETGEILEPLNTTEELYRQGVEMRNTVLQ